MDEDERYLDLPDPDTEPDPEFAGMSWITIVELIDEYEWEARQYEMDRYHYLTDSDY